MYFTQSLIRMDGNIKVNKTGCLSLTDLWFSVRLRWRLMSSKASLRKVSLLTSCCWHWSNTCSMLSMYWGVHLFSSSRDFSYFSLAWDKKTENTVLTQAEEVVSYWFFHFNKGSSVLINMFILYVNVFLWVSTENNLHRLLTWCPVLFSPSAHPVCICQLSRGVSSAGPVWQKPRFCRWPLGLQPASPPCRPCDMLS